MVRTRMLYLISDYLREGQDIYIVCAGKLGIELCACLLEAKCNVVAFIDNNESLQGQTVVGKPIIKMDNYGEDCLYIIANADDNVRNNLRQELQSREIDNSIIFEYCRDIEYKYWSTLPRSKYREEISMLYLEEFSRDMNWDNPQTYNEIINWEKINAKDNTRKAELADKYKVRKWVSEHIGDEHLVKYLGVWDSPDDIDFESLPDRFVLKSNNGSGRNIIVKDKKKLNIQETKDKLNKWLDQNYGYMGLATHYLGIEPRIVCEEYLDGLAESVYDYDVFCFHGEPEYICCIEGSHREKTRSSYFDKKWNLQPFSYGWPGGLGYVDPPKELNIILEFSRVLSKEFKHARVDWYIMPDGRILFSEITFATWGGLRRFVPEEYDLVFGKLINEL